jgi:peptide chain release factor 1
MQDRRDELEAEYEAVCRRLEDPHIAQDRAELRQLSRRHKELGAVVSVVRSLRAAEVDAEAARELAASLTGEDREWARDELAAAQAAVARCNDELRALLLPKDPNDGRNVLLSIRGAEGGKEANLFAKDLYEMYQRYAERRGWTTEVISTSLTDLGGIDEATIAVRGADAWQRLAHEAGVHRVQRVPVTESQGRVHTSSAAVNVLPEADEIDVELDVNELRIDVYRSTGPGGQSVNTTDSAVRVTHLPTGIVVAMQDEKSQIQNRAKALQVLRARILQFEQERQALERSAERRAQVGSAGRSEKIRTYNFKENRVTDHRIGLTLHKLDRVLAGELDELVDALIADERTRQLASPDAPQS